HKIVFHKSTIHLFPTKIHKFSEKSEKMLWKKSTSQQVNEFWVCYGSDGSVLGLMGAETPI
ncbi:MAG: hypothetical protein SPF44_03380, partial [Sodaliphilus sp.]|nr:hypothetical protein [Sodaliphilus sp.]